MVNERIKLPPPIKSEEKYEHHKRCGIGKITRREYESTTFVYWQ